MNNDPAESENPYPPLQPWWEKTKSPFVAILVLIGLLLAAATCIYVIYGWDKLLSLLSYIGF